MTLNRPRAGGLYPVGVLLIKLGAKDYNATLVGRRSTEPGILTPMLRARRTVFKRGGG